MFPILSVNPILLKIIYGFVALWSVKYLLSFIERLRRLPPGPWGLPFVGYLPFLKNDTYLQFVELAKKYGPIFSLKCGSFDLVVLNEAKAIHEALASERVLARPDFFFLGSDSPSLIEMSGEVWKEQRRVALTLFRNLGLGKSKLEEKIKEEINKFLEVIKEGDGKTLNFAESIPASVANNITILLFGHGYEYNDPESSQMRESSANLGQSFHFFSADTFCPLYTKIVNSLTFLETVRKENEETEKFEAPIKKELIAHKEKGAIFEIEDYVDGFLQEMEKQKDKKNSSFNLDVLQRNTVDFYQAGADTTSITLNWIMLFLAAFPEHQKRIREEIKEFIGSERQPDYGDRQKMPFTMAFISEALRVSSVATINLLRRTTEDVEIGGVMIPKDVIVVMNFWTVHHDPNLWEDPESFKPERFLNENETELIKSSNLIPFSAGKRVCPGAGLAWVELFLYLTRIVQKFEIKAPNGKKISKPFESRYNFFRYPLQSEFVFCSLN